MDGLTGLTGIAGYQTMVDTDSQATPEDRSGNTADPRHSYKGTTVRPYPWEARSTQAAGMHGPYGPENQLLGDEWWFFQPAGMVEDDPTFDRTPARRAAPWPKGIASGRVPGETPDDIADQLTQSHAIHSVDLGAASRMQQQPDPLQDEWEAVTEVNSGYSEQQPIPKQMMSSGFGFGTRDRVQSMARQNDYGYDSKHMLRRYATGSIPGNTMWLRPGGRPLVKSLPGPARPAIGRDTPFAGDDLGRAFSIDGAVLQNVPSEYAPPPQPSLAPAVVSPDTSDALVEWY
jgi:hypothetical protein